MFTFLPVIHHELASLTAPAPVAMAVPAPPPAWPAPARETEEVIEGRFCVVRVARGFARKGFVKKPAAPVSPEVRTGVQAMMFDPNSPDWPAPPRRAAVELKLPRRAAVVSEEAVRSSEVPSLPC